MHTISKECKIIADTVQEMTTEDIYKLCRFCAKNNSYMMSIFSDQGLADELPSKIKTYLPVEVSETDILPVQVCKPCAQCLIMWHKFIVGCLKADEFLRSVFEKFREKISKCVDESGKKKEKKLHDRLQPSHQLEMDVTTNTVHLTGINETDSTLDTERSQRYHICHLPGLASQIERNRTQNSSEMDNIPENVAESVNTILKVKDCSHNFSENQTSDNFTLKIVVAENKCGYRVSQKFCKQRTGVTSDNGGKESSVCQTKPENLQASNNSLSVLDGGKINKCNSKGILIGKGCDCEIQNSSKNKLASTISSFKYQDTGAVNIPSQYDKEAQTVLEKHKDKKSKNQRERFNRNSDKESKHSDTTKLLVKKTLKMKKQSEASFHCNDCGKVFFHKDGFRRHLRIHSDERPFICHMCGKGFRDSGALCRHLQHVHAGIKNFKCDICCKHFASKATCDDHRRTHTGERPFVCAVCGKCFRSKAGLYIHVKIHTDCFPYSCNFCEKHFRRNQELLAHKRIHTGERPYICDICGKQFRVGNEMVRHKAVHSKDKPYSCTICGMSFRQKRYLKNHCKKQHTNSQNNSL